MATRKGCAAEVVCGAARSSPKIFSSSRADAAEGSAFGAGSGNEPLEVSHAQGSGFAVFAGEGLRVVGELLERLLTLPDPLLEHGTRCRVLGLWLPRCGQHRCWPLSNSSLRKVRAVLMRAGKRAVRWGWVGVNPFELGEPISVPRFDPQPPTPSQAATIAATAWHELDWGMLVWLALVTGARRGELCALTWNCLDVDTRVLTIRSSIAQEGARTWEKETKVHQQRRITVDEQTATLLGAYRRHCAQRAGTDTEMPDDARIFSLSPGGSTWLKPDSVSQRYKRMCTHLGWDMNIHQLRHYSATELIAAGVDVRTVAGRLGHSGGGTTTLRVYSAWVSEADQRAAGTLVGRMPELPEALQDAGTLEVPEPPDLAGGGAAAISPYQRTLRICAAAYFGQVSDFRVWRTL